jgi:DNA-directed RNA polymerase specialized sigma24 family protein
VHYAPRDQPDQRSGFEPWELELVRSQVFDFISAHTLPRDVEIADLDQECLQHWWSQRDRYDEHRGASRKTFLRKVVRAKLLDLARGWKAEKRGAGLQPLSLDAPMPGNEPDGPTIGDLLADQRTSDSTLALDIQRLTDRLSARQRWIIGGTRLGVTKIEISRWLGISRDTLHEELRRIREVFRDGDLAPHLD